MQRRDCFLILFISFVIMVATTNQRLMAAQDDDENGENNKMSFGKKSFEKKRV